MTDLKFFAKTFALTVAVVLVMQIQVGNHTLENHAMSWVQSSSVVAPLHSVARGAGKMLKDSISAINKAIQNQFHKKQKEEK
jgi:hypothetical protein